VARCSLSHAHILGFTSFFAAFLLALVDVSFAVAPLFLFVILCIIAPFLPRFGFFLPIISRGNSGQKAVSITFDDGPDPFSTEPLLNLLDQHGVKATFFVVGKKAAAHPQLIKKILKMGHLLGNHSYSHDNLCMLKSRKHLFQEISAAQEILARFHVKTLVFRPPVGITNPKLLGVLKDLGMVIVNFTRRGMDFGNRRLKGLSKRILKHLRSDHIIALHDVSPTKRADLPLWLNEIDKVLQGINDRGMTVLPLSELMGRPVMIETPDTNDEKVLRMAQKKA
jgi:peptidoglycan/xylan/chitin deacetylase (PgdA/CDA1 family)